MNNKSHLVSLAAKIKDAREQLGINQEQAANRANIGVASWRRVEQQQKVRPGTLRAIADALHLPAEELIREANGERVQPIFQKRIANATEIHAPVAADNRSLLLQSARARRSVPVQEASILETSDSAASGGQTGLCEEEGQATSGLDAKIEVSLAEVDSSWHLPSLSIADTTGTMPVTLPPELQRLFDRLAALPGLVPLEALAKICDEPGAEKHIIRLQEYGLISVERINDKPFIRLLHRQDTAAIARGLAEYYCVMALESAEKHFIPNISANGGLAIEEHLRPFFPELKRALEWYLEQGDVETTLRFAFALTMRPIEGSTRLEMRQWLEYALARPGAEKPTVARAQALMVLATLTEIRQAERLYKEALILFKRLGQESEVANTLRRMAILKRHQGNFRQARKRFEESRALYQKRLDTAPNRTDKLGLAMLLNSYANLESQEQNYSTARKLYNTARQIHEEEEDQDRLAGVLDNLGYLEFQAQQYANARGYYEQSASIREKLGLTANAADSLYNLADVAMYQGDYVESEHCFRRSLERWQHVAHPAMIAEVLEGYASLKLKQEQPERAARLFGAAQAIRKSVADPPPPSERTGYPMDVTATRAALDRSVFEAEWEAGRQMSLSEAIHHALNTPHIQKAE